MGSKQRVPEGHASYDENPQEWIICLHSFSNLSRISPVVFLYLLKECYVRGTFKATKKFRALHQQVHQVLNSAPQPGPATFIAHCLYVLPLFELYSEGLSHLLLSALRRTLRDLKNEADSSQAKNVAAKLFLDVVRGFVKHDERIIVKIVETFNVKLVNLENVTCNLEGAHNNNFLDLAKTLAEQYILKIIESESYMTAVTLLEQFSIRQSGQSFLLNMIEKKQFRAAEKWATFMGRTMLSVLIHEYINRKLLKNAYQIIKRNNLQQEFPNVYHKFKESSLKKLAQKGCWDIAEARTKNDTQLIEFLVYLALEAGYLEKVDELCKRYSLEGFVKTEEVEASSLQSRYLQLNELVEDIIWVDDISSLLSATCQIEGSKVVGVDCEWKPNYVKGGKVNRVSIMQIASGKVVFIFDLIKLSEDVRDTLDECLTRILHSPGILKLGYNFQCDIKQLAQAYDELKCFKHYEMLLDIQNVFKERRGGLSGLAKKMLGAGLNKTRRNSDWEQRPLSQNQLEYAALDAAVLICIFSRIQSPQPAKFSGGQATVEWTSYIVSHADYVKKPK